MRIRRPTDPSVLPSYPHEPIEPDEPASQPFAIGFVSSSRTDIHEPEDIEDEDKSWDWDKIQLAMYTISTSILAALGVLWTIRLW